MLPWFELSVLPTALPSPTTFSSPTTMVPDTSRPAATPPPDAVTVSRSNIWSTSPSAQMFWLTDESTIVSRSSIAVVLYV